MANSISGNAGVASALVILGGASTATVVADGLGNFTFAGLAAGIYSVQCQLSGKVFSPHVSSQTVVASDITGVNFIVTNAALNSAVWYKMGVVLPPNTTQLHGGSSISGVAEATVIFEAGAQILSGSVFKMWFTGGAANAALSSINYAESTDGINWTQFSGNPVINSHSAGRVIKNGNTYYGYFTNGVGDIGSTIDRYTSPDGVVWTLANSAVLSVGAAGSWDDFQIYNMQIVQIDSNGTWWAVYGGNRNHNVLSTGVATSPDGITWTKNPSNPVIQNFSSAFVKKINNLWYSWADLTVYGQGGSNPFEFPTDFQRALSIDLINWSIPIPSVHRTDVFEGVGAANAQLDSPALLEVSGKSYMWYEGSPTAAGGSGFQIGLAIANATLSQLVFTNEGVLGHQQSINKTANTTGGTGMVQVLANPVVAGNTVFVFDTNGSSTGVTDNQGNTYVQAAPALFSGSTKLWMCANLLATGNLTITVACPNASNISMAFAEYATGGIVNPQDVAISTLQASGTNLAIGPVTTALKNELVIFFGTVYSSTANSIPTAPGFVTRLAQAQSNSAVIQDSLVALAGNTSFSSTAVSNAFGAPMFLVSIKTQPLSFAYSVPDCRVAPSGPNSGVTVQGTTLYTGQNSSNSAVPSKDSRAAGVPVDSRIAANIPQNSRTPGIYGPGVN